ncbi:39S ribosomal protein L9, mitochondrial isoform X2 [Nilaparvata lugens]|uniref:39S ribosomal protein L9, mitochondrial isoform X1 n=1 Tax=Nilaparvata lugens TaxID=108931 RepID=UPI00193E54FC|nr:39S ribosomal protein L9, mitochondrial isoform X1 [Nilaparvata lugens]XP_039282362.1 39S ribosomal protein L9, mitochondrial isoform X2 [Nilaparvata lugens]
MLTHQVYEVEARTDNQKEGHIEVVLKQFVQGLGNKGEVVSVKRSVAYNDLLMPGIAMYATEDEKQKAVLYRETRKTDEEDYSSVFVTRTVAILSKAVYGITMNLENKWVLEPWHVRSALRRCGTHILDESCIEMPKTKIEGPDMNLEGKEFFVTITINNKEKVKTRLRIHHWSTDICDRLPQQPYHWTKRAEALFPEQKEELDALPLPLPPKKEEEEC